MSFTCKRVFRYYAEGAATMRHVGWEVGFDEFMGGTSNEVKYQVVARLEDSVQAAQLCNFLNGGDTRTASNSAVVAYDHIALLLGKNLPEHDERLD